MPNPGGGTGGISSTKDCTTALSQGAAFFGLIWNPNGDAAAEACKLTLSEYGRLFRISGMEFVPPAGLSLTDPFAAMCPEACSAHGVFAPGCAPPPSPGLPPSPPQPPRPPVSPPPPPQPPQHPLQLPPPLTPQLSPCTDMVMYSGSELFNGAGCAPVLPQSAATLRLFLGSELSEGESSAMLCSLPVGQFAVMAQAGGVEFMLPASVSLADPFAVICPETCSAHGVFAPGCAPPPLPPPPPPLLPPSPPPPPTSPPFTPIAANVPESQNSKMLWAILPLFVLLVAALVIHYRLYARGLRNEANNLRISRDRANLDLQMSVHVNEVMQRSFREELSSRKELDAQRKEYDTASSGRTSQVDDIDSLPDSFPTLRSAASLPPGPPSSSTGHSEGEQQEVMHKVPPTPPFNLAVSSSSAPVFNLAASSSLGPLHRATSSAPTKKRAPPGSAAAPKKVYSNPYTVFCQEQRPLLPRSLRNSQREWTLGQMWKSLPDEERAKYKPEDGTVRKAARCIVGLIPSPSPAPTAGPTRTAARVPSLPTGPPSSTSSRSTAPPPTRSKPTAPPPTAAELVARHVEQEVAHVLLSCATGQTNHQC